MLVYYAQQPERVINVGDAVKATHTPQGGDHHGKEHTLQPGAIGEVASIWADGQVDVVYWIDPETHEDRRHIVQCYSWRDGDVCGICPADFDEIAAATKPDVPAGIPIQNTLTWDHIAALMCSAVEGGSNYWCASLRRKVKPVVYERTEGCAWYYDPAFWASTGWVLKAEDAEGDDGPWELRQEDFAERVQKWARERPHHVADIIAENGDSCTGDSFLQYVMLGEEVYG